MDHTAADPSSTTAPPETIAPATAAVPEAPPALHDVRRRITVDEFHRMCEAGVFGPEPKVELIEGVIIDKMGKNPPHELAAELVLDLFFLHARPGDLISAKSTLAIEERNSAPEPDLMLLRGNRRDYTGRRRTPADAALVVEVSHSSYPIDRHIKWRAYADAGVPVYWLLDLNRRTLEVHSEPAGAGPEATYRSTRVYLESEEAPLTLDGREVARFAVKDILP